MSAIENIDACVFDAYGTLFDVAAAASRCRDELGDRWAPLAATWRDKQLQYTWLRNLADEFVPFWQVTQDALDYALDSLEIDDAALRRRLLDVYFRLDAYPEVQAVLEALRANDMPAAILSNGSMDMLQSAVDHAGLKLDAVISVDRVGVFKTADPVYQLACDELGVVAERICFMSSNGWDAWAASHFGFRVVWVNRLGQPAERLPGAPDAVIDDLSALPALLGID